MSESTQTQAMQTQTIQFDLVSPERKLISENVAMVVVPGEEGDFGVLAQHAPLVSTIRTGVLNIYQLSKQDTPIKIFIDGGFADVTGTQCTVLAEYAIKLSDIDQGELTQKIQELQGDLELAAGEDDIRRISKKLNVELAKQSALSEAA